MANEKDKPEEAAGDTKLVAYKLLMDIGANKTGDVIYIPEKIGEELIKGGFAALAAAEDMNSEEEVEDAENEEEMPDDMVTNSVDKKIDAVVKAAQATAAKAFTAAPQTIPAELKVPLYKSNGHYLRDCIRATIKGDRQAQQKARAFEAEIAKSYEKQGLVIKSPLGINETTNSQGGYLVNPQFSPDVYTIPHGQPDLLAMCDKINATSNVYNQRFVNESNLALGSIYGGLNMVATAEGASFTSSLPAWSNVTFTLQKEAIFAYITTEELEDVSYPLEAELNEYTAKAFIYGLNQQLVQGSTLEGLLNAPSLVTVTSSSNDTAFHTTPGTCLTYADIVNIWSRVYVDCQSSPKGVWLFHPGLQASLNSMAFTFNGATPAWGLTYDAREGMGGEGFTPYRLMGKKAFACWACSAPGLAGDIIYVDLGTCRNYTRPYRVEISKDVQFLTDQIAVRFVNRLDAKTVFRNAVTGPAGATTYSAVVTRSSVGT